MKTAQYLQSAVSFGVAGGRRPSLKLAQYLLITLFVIGVFVNPAASNAASIAVGISVGVAPPPIPVYTQPPCPAPGYLWTPGYWAYDPVHGYYWVPGTWVMPPTVGVLWTPGYWGWGGAAFVWHPGYWGPHVGFYGGINYGFGFFGVGFVGGEWRGGTFFYNRAVVNFGPHHFDHFYDRPVRGSFAVNRISYNGGRGGLMARPTPLEMQAGRERHFDATGPQRQHEMGAQRERGQFAAYNQGRPSVAASGRPGEFRGSGAVAANRAGGPVNANQYRGGNAATHNANSAGVHQTFTANHQNAPASNNYNRGAAGNNHQPAYQQGAHAENRGNTGYSRPPASHQGGPGGEPRGNESHGNESRGGDSHHR